MTPVTPPGAPLRPSDIAPFVYVLVCLLICLGFIVHVFVQCASTLVSGDATVSAPDNQPLHSEELP